MRFSETATLDLPDTDNSYGTTSIYIGNADVSIVTVGWNGALATGGAIAVRVLKDGGDPDTAADFVDVARLTSPGTVTLARRTGVKVQGLSGSGTGTVAVTVNAA